MKLCIIPARGGSKRIPRKNVKPFCGKPMIAWSIETAQRSQCFDRIVVSTDDDEIAEIARRCGVEVPFLRPPELADDRTATMPVIAHSIRWFTEQGEKPSEVCCLYATAPFTQVDDLRRGLDVLRREGCEYVFPVTSYAFPIQRAVCLTSAGRIEMLQPEHFGTRSQDLEEAYHDAGQFYWGRADAWVAGKPMFSSDAAPIVLPRHRVQDIDTPEDWVQAEWLFKAMIQSA